MCIVLYMQVFLRGVKLVHYRIYKSPILKGTSFQTVLKTEPLLVNVSNLSNTAAKSLQSCLTLCDPRDGSPPGSPVPGILQARTLEWVAISFSNAWKWEVKVKLLSRVRLLATPWTAAHQGPPSMGFSRQQHWNGVPLRTRYCQTLLNPCQLNGYKILSYCGLNLHFNFSWFVTWLFTFFDGFTIWYFWFKMPHFNRQIHQ